MRIFNVDIFGDVVNAELLANDSVNEGGAVATGGACGAGISFAVSLGITEAVLSLPCVLLPKPNNAVCDT